MSQSHYPKTEYKDNYVKESSTDVVSIHSGKSGDGKVPSNHVSHHHVGLAAHHHDHHGHLQGGNHKIYLACQLSVLKIDDINQTFQSDFHIYTYFQNNPADPNAKDELVLLKDMNELPWRPHFQFLSLSDVPIIIEENAYVNARYGDVFLSQNYVIVVKDIMELHRFPFDRQLFMVQFSSNGCSFHSDFPEGVRGRAPPNYPEDFDDSEKCNLIQVSLGVESATWKLETIVANCLAEEESEMSIFDIQLRVERKSSYFLYNIVVPLFLMGLVSLMAFVIKLPDDGSPSDRFSFLMTLILTSVAFKFIVSGLVPKTCYLTLLDKYTLIAFSFMILILAKDFCLGLIFTRYQHRRCHSNRLDYLPYIVSVLGSLSFVHCLWFYF